MTGADQQRKSDRVSLARWRDVAFLYLLLASLAAIVATDFVHREDPVYLWDFRHYWTVFQHYGELIASGAPWVGEARESIRTADYNPVGAILLAPLYLVAGGGRDVYVSAIAALFLVPSALLAAWLATRSAAGGRAAFALVAVLAFLYVPFWRPTLRGMVDIAGLVPLGAASALILFRGERHEPGRLAARALAIGFLLWLAFLLRRHYAYVVVVLFMLFAWTEAARAFRQRDTLSVAAQRMLISALAVPAFLVPALALQWDLVLRAGANDYSALYQAYQRPLAIQLEIAATKLGQAFVLVTVVGTVVAIRQRNSAVLALLIVAVTTFLLFGFTQSMGDHHFLPVAFFVFPVIALPAVALLRRGTGGARALAALFPLVAAAGFVHATQTPDPPGRYLPSLVAYALPEALPPVRLERIEVYRDLARRLEELSAPTERIVMFASREEEASDELFRVIDPALAPRLLQTSHIGEVTLFEFADLSAEWAVAFDPLPTHMATGSQDHLVLANDRLLRGEGFGAAFAPTGEAFVLAEGVRATILHRERPVSADEVDELYGALVARFPGWRLRPQFTMSRYLAAREVSPGDVYGSFSAVNPTSFIAHPGASEPTRVRFGETGDGGPALMTVRVHEGDALCEEANGVGVTIGNEREGGVRVVLRPGQAEEFAFPDPTTAVELAIDPNGVPTCDTVFVSFASSR